MKYAIVTGAGGFIGHHMVSYLKAAGYWVRGVDIKLPEFEATEADHFILADLREWEINHIPLDERLWSGIPKAAIPEVYHFAADMGGMGYIATNNAHLAMWNTRIDLNMARIMIRMGGRILYASSACVYPEHEQGRTDIKPLKEGQAFPAAPDTAYGWEKLYMELLLHWLTTDHPSIHARIVRFHNVYGPCFDEQTEALTAARGWKRFSDLADDDVVATLNPSNGHIEYQYPTVRQAYHYSGDMYRVTARGVDLLVTPNHQMWYSVPTTKEKSRAYTDFQLEQADALRWTERQVLNFSCAAKWGGDSAADPVFLPATPKGSGPSTAAKEICWEDWLEFVGWYVSEGSSWITPTNHTVCISQKPGKKHDAILAVLDRTGFNSHVGSSGKDIIVSSKQLYLAIQRFGHGAHHKHLPQEYCHLEPKLLGILFDALMDGDGDADGHRYTTASEQLAGQIQEIALKLGKRAVVTKADYYRVYICDQTFIWSKRKHRNIEHYDGMVYDVTVPQHHILLVRRNGKPIWSGNCGTYDGGREKAPAALCRKIAKAEGRGLLEVWGDGKQTRSFMYIDDCVEGIHRIMQSSFVAPLNLGRDEMVSIDDLAALIMDIAGKKLDIVHDLTKPQGVRGRNSDNSLLRSVLGWEPPTPITQGLIPTYEWIAGQIARESD